MNPRYPVYIISKGRWKLRNTARALDKIGVPYHIVIEEPEYEQYASVIDKSKILVHPHVDEGAIPGRNWIWQHSIDNGHKRHWVLDDNIRTFYRFTNNVKHYCTDGTCFAVLEDWADRYLNAAQVGMQYEALNPKRSKYPKAYVANTRIYSCILNQNDLPVRWRGIFNSDTDLSLRLLKLGYCTMLSRAFLCEKRATMKMSGGNTERYQGDGRLKMAKYLQQQHPDCVKVVWKWNRWQHEVNYKPFRNNKLIRDPNYVARSGIDEYGMEIRTGE